MKKIWPWLVALLIALAWIAPSPLWESWDDLPDIRIDFPWASTNETRIQAAANPAPTKRPDTGKSTEGDSTAFDEFLAEYGSDNQQNGKTNVLPRTTAPPFSTFWSQVQAPSPTPERKNYVLNTNTHKFHYPTCSSVDQMKESNKKYYYGTRTEVIEMGYEPCGRCHP